MKLFSPRSVWSRLTFVAALLAGGLALAGCGTAFTPKHRVLVDAITLSGTPKPTGLSYRLVARPSVVTAAGAQIPVVKACVDAALSGQGMFEAPATAAPDLFIEVGFGREASTRADPSVRETYLQLSARSNPQRSVDRATGVEVWDVRVAVLGIAGAIESAMPMLSYVAVGNLASDTRLESTVEVAQNDPAIDAIRQAAIKLLDSRAVTPAAGGTGTTATATPGSPSPGAAALGPTTR